MGKRREGAGCSPRRAAPPAGSPAALVGPPLSPAPSCLRFSRPGVHSASRARQLLPRAPAHRRAATVGREFRLAPPGPRPTNGGREESRFLFNCGSGLPLVGRPAAPEGPQQPVKIGPLLSLQAGPKSAPAPGIPGPDLSVQASSELGLFFFFFAFPFYCLGPHF